MPIPSSPLLVLLLTAGLAPATETHPRSSSAEEVATSLRALIEPAFREANGFGFRSFGCELRRPLRPGDRFDCAAVDEEGTPIRYVLAVDESSRAHVALASFPASEIPAEVRAEAEPPCRAFLEAFERASWETLGRALHPDLGNERSPEFLREQLEPIRSAMGRLRSSSLREAASRSTRNPGVRHTELVRALDSENGLALARLGLVYDGEVPKLLAFTVQPEPGSTLQAAICRAAFPDRASKVLGETVKSLSAPFERLVSQGDTVVGTVTLASGRELAARFEQSGRRDDFEANDYRIQVLDPPWLIRKSLASRSLESESVRCPAGVVPDGGSLTCEAVLKSGERYAVTLRRDGGEHTMTAARAPVSS